MTKEQLRDTVQYYVPVRQHAQRVMDAVEAYLSASNNAKLHVSGRSEQVCPHCKAKHSETDCQGYCTASCLQEDEGQTCH